MAKLRIQDLPLKGMRVLMRVDFNVPMDDSGNITDDSRIQAALQSIHYVLDQGGSLVLMSHLGRPKGEPNPKYSLAPIAKRLSELLKHKVDFLPDCIGAEIEKRASKLKSGEILLLENLRFHKGEEKPEENPDFTKSLAKLGDVYVNDAFGSAHRAHASTALIAKCFPKKSAAGFLMENEISHLSPLLHHPSHPFYAIIGGAKVSTKAGVIHNLLKKIDALFIGGAMAFTFFKAEGIKIGNSPFEKEEIENVKEILKSNKPIFLPKDLVIAKGFSNDAEIKTVKIEEGIPENWQGMDIGSETIEEWSKQLKKASTVFWNGPLGVFEMENFAKGTQKIAHLLSEIKGDVVVGGGDSIAAIMQMGIQNKFTHLSTGGGASLEFLEYGHLPGIDALSEIG